MKELHVLLDYENVQPTLAQLAKLVPGFTDVWLFHGPHQKRQAQKLVAGHARVTAVPRSGRGPNALDFHLSFYLGYVAAKHPEAELLVIANDQGYDPMIEHATLLGFHVKRLAFKSSKAPTAKQMPSAQEAAAAPVVPALPVPVVRVSPAKKAVATKAPVTAKKEVPKKATAQSAPTKKVSGKAPVKKSLAKKVPTTAPAKQMPVKRAAAKSVPAKKIVAHTPTPKFEPPASPVSADAKVFERICKGLAKMGDKRPHKLKPFLRHLESMLGQSSSPAALESMVRRLEQQNVVHIAGDLVLYS